MNKTDLKRDANTLANHSQINSGHVLQLPHQIKSLFNFAAGS